MSRLFFALWPQAQVRRQIADVAGSQVCAGRQVTPQRLHLTLRFLGEVTQEHQTALRSAAGAIRVPAFTLELSELGYFKLPRIAWLGPEQLPRAFLDLVEAINMACGQVGLAREPRAFRPHVSLARDAPAPAVQRLEKPIIWRVSEFSLCDSLLTEQGPIYRNAGCWPLVSSSGM